MNEEYTVAYKTNSAPTNRNRFSYLSTTITFVHYCPALNTWCSLSNSKIILIGIYRIFQDGQDEYTHYLMIFSYLLSSWKDLVTAWKSRATEGKSARPQLHQSKHSLP